MADIKEEKTRFDIFFTFSRALLCSASKWNVFHLLAFFIFYPFEQNSKYDWTRVSINNWKIVNLKIFVQVAIDRFM